MPNCCLVTPPLQQPPGPIAPVSAVITGGPWPPDALTGNTCPCPVACTGDLKPKGDGWSGWSGTVSGESSGGSPGAFDVEVEITCVTEGGQDGYLVRVRCEQCDFEGEAFAGGSCNIVGGLVELPASSDCCVHNSGQPPAWQLVIGGSMEPLPICFACNDDICESCGAESLEPIRYASGEVVLTATDIQGGGFGNSWRHTRTFQSRMSANGDRGNGFNWTVREWPYVARGVPANRTSSIVAVLGSPRPYWYQEQSNDQYQTAFNDKAALALSRTNRRWTFSLPDGRVQEFDQHSGRLVKQTLPGGQVIEVKSTAAKGTKFGTVEQSYTSGGSTIVEQFLYEYTQPYDKQLQSVTLRRQTDGGAWENVQRATYTYYGFRSSFGSFGDLQSVTTQVWQSGAWVGTGTTLYRYWKQLSSSSSSSSSGPPVPQEPPGVHLLKYVVLPAAYEKLAADPNVSDPLTASDSLVAQYADYFYAYDDQRRVIQESVQGGSQSFSFSYTNSAFADGYNAWKTKTVETRPDGAENVVYANFAGQTMLKVLKNGSDEWCEFWKYGTAGAEKAKVVLHANPSAVSGYDEQYADLLNEVDGNYEFLRDYAGKIDLYTYDTQSGYMASEMVREGEFGNCFKLRERTYVSCCPSGGSPSSSSGSSGSGAAGQCIYFPSQLIEYPDTGLPCDPSSSSSSSSAPTGGCVNDGTRQIVTSWSYTFYPGTCAIQQRTTVWPVVSTDQNGSGVTTSRKEYFDQWGNLTWIMDERGFMTRNTYDIPTGALIERIDDMDTSQVSNEPPGWETPTGGGLHLITDFEHDVQGRQVESRGPAHEVDIDGVATEIRTATFTVYRDDIHEVWTGQGYQRVSDGAYFLANPVQIVKSDAQGRVLKQISAVRLPGSSSSSSG